MLITIHARQDGIHYYWHPFLLRQRQFGWAEVELQQFSSCCEIFWRKRPVSPPAGGAATGTRVAGISIRHLFHAAGALVGLDRWAINDELQMLRHLKSRCEALRLPLLVLGPSRRLESIRLDRLCRRLDHRLLTVLPKWRLAYCSLPDTHDPAGHVYYGADGWHFTPSGHG